ncbi:MAG: propionyl-CoA synthetase, partial [Bacteroidota bacterium]
TYQHEYTQSLQNPEDFWRKQAENIAWYEPPTKILQTDEHGYGTWYADGTLNTAYLALDYHIEQGRGGQAAIVYDSPVSDTKETITYTQLRDRVAVFAGALKEKGVTKGDTVVIYMPMIPETVVAMLACARLGAIHSVVCGGFAPHELAIRIDDAKPKLIISASCGIEFSKIIEYKPLVDEAIEEATHKPLHTIIFQRPMAKASMKSDFDLDWNELIKIAQPADCVPVKSTDPLYIIYTSGTTGKPKGVVRDNGGHAVAMRYTLQNVYGMNPGEVFWAASDVGWVVGHSYIVYSPLLHGCTTILFEGKPIKTPDAGTFWRIIAENKVKVMFTAPTAIRAIKKFDPEGEFIKKYDLSSLKTFFLAGERCDPTTLEWLTAQLQIPVIDHWWQTESGSPMIANMMGIEPQPIKVGSSALPVSGYDVQVLSASGKELSAHEEGAIAIKLPLPPGCLTTIWKDADRFVNSYLSAYSGYYLSGDGGYKDEDGYIYIMGRIDDVINVSGHRLSTGEMEEIVAAHPAVAECAVIGVADGLKGQVPVGLAVLKSDASLSAEELEKELIAEVRQKIGAVACFKKAYVVERLPKTRSGKILRKIIRKIADQEPYNMPSTIDDPMILDEIKGVFRS